MKSTIRTAFCGAAAALEVLLLFLTNIFPTATIALPAVAGVLLMAVVIEFSPRWAFGVFAVASVLSFFLMSDKEAFLLYVCFLGYYPILKAVFEKEIHSQPLCWVCKLLTLNVAAVVDVLLVLFVFRVPMESFAWMGLLAVLLWVGLNVIFVVYDRALSGLVWLYWRRLHPMFARMLGNH